MNRWNPYTDKDNVFELTLGSFRVGLRFFRVSFEFLSGFLRISFGLYLGSNLGSNLGYLNIHSASVRLPCGYRATTVNYGVATVSYGQLL